MSSNDIYKTVGGIELKLGCRHCSVMAIQKDCFVPISKMADGGHLEILQTTSLSKPCRIEPKLHGMYWGDMEIQKC